MFRSLSSILEFYIVYVDLNVRAQRHTRSSRFSVGLCLCGTIGFQPFRRPQWPAASIVQCVNVNTVHASMISPFLHFSCLLWICCHFFVVFHCIAMDTLFCLLCARIFHLFWGAQFRYNCSHIIRLRCDEIKQATDEELILQKTRCSMICYLWLVAVACSLPFLVPTYYDISLSFEEFPSEQLLLNEPKPMCWGKRAAKRKRKSNDARSWIIGRLWIGTRIKATINICRMIRWHFFSVSHSVSGLFFLPFHMLCVGFFSIWFCRLESCA